MATLEKAICNNLFDSILPKFGTTPKVNVPIWDESQKMFIFDQFESANGHHYYRGIRFCDQMAIVENVGLYHSWTYIDSIELYAFNGQKIVLIQKKLMNKVFREESVIRRESEQMVKNYLRGCLKISRQTLSDAELNLRAKTLVDSCYKSYLDSDYNIQLMEILPAIEEK